MLRAEVEWRREGVGAEVERCVEKDNVGVGAVEGVRVGPRAYGNARRAQKKDIEEGPRREVK